MQQNVWYFWQATFQINFWTKAKVINPCQEHLQLLSYRMWHKLIMKSKMLKQIQTMTWYDPKTQPKLIHPFTFNWRKKGRDCTHEFSFLKDLSNFFINFPSALDWCFSLILFSQMEQLNLENETFLCWSNHQIEFPKTIEERWMMERQKNLLFIYLSKINKTRALF